MITYERAQVEIGRIKNLVSYWDEENKTLYLERQETKGVFFPIYAGEVFHLIRVLVRVFQRFRVWKKKKAVTKK